jgi:uncharacterized protein YbjT (DUF2867 family)
MILVTGASGTVGKEVVKALSASGARYRAGYRTRPQNLPTGVDGVALDYDKPETIRPALQGIETVFLLSSTVAPETAVVDEAKRAGVKRVVKLSAYGAEKEEFTFGRWHRAVEKHVEASGLAWTFLRPNNFMQNVLHYMAGTIRSKGEFYASAGDGAVATIDAADIGACAARVLTAPGHEGKAYALTGPAALTYAQFAEVLTRVLGKPVRYVPVSGEQYKQAAVSAGTPPAYADALVDLNRHIAEGRMSRVTSAVKDLTGRDPATFEHFARDHAAALR